MRRCGSPSGIQGHWGGRNVFYANAFLGTIPGEAVHLAYNPLGNVVACDNTAPTASRGLSNKPCQR